MADCFLARLATIERLLERAKAEHDRPGASVGTPVVETARGAVTVKEREGLEECANGLYGVPEAEFERLFG